ncbi:MAG: sensor histidine kinase [Actinomycetota bacterium]|nr:sensor histidine kinase [Actinomycetota bacterium]
MGSLWSLARRYGFDVLILVGALGGALAVALAGHSADAPHTTRWLTAPATAIIVLPLLARRRFPFAAPLSVWLLGTAFSFVDGRLVPFTPSISVAGLAGAFLLGNRNGVEAGLGMAAVVGGTAIIVSNNPSHATAELVFVPLSFAIGWLAGFALRERAEQAEAAEVRATQAERERETAARIAVAEERARIARELHDIVAHAVSVMVLQVGAVRHKLPDAMVEDSDALRNVEQAGRTALTEMRRLLAAMRNDADEAELTPQPGLDGLGSLLEEIGRAGLPVQLHVDGDPFPLPRAIDLSAYRIVQEGLTNALKHARASNADVTVRYRSDELQLEVRDNGEGSSTSNGLGHGLVGIRERVKIYGGEMTAGTTNGGGFTLSTRLPLSGQRQ